MKMWKIVTLVIALIGIGVPLVAEFTTWLSPAVKAGVVALAPPVTVALILVGYLNWRTAFKRRILGEDRHDDTLASAA